MVEKKGWYYMRFEIYEGVANRPYKGEKQGWIQGDLDEAREFIENAFINQYGTEVFILALTPTTIFAQDEEGNVFAVAVIG